MFELLELLSRLATTASLRGWVGFTLECRHALKTKEAAVAPTVALNMASPQPAASSSSSGLGAKGDIVAGLEALKLPEGGSHQLWSRQSYFGNWRFHNVGWRQDQQQDATEFCSIRSYQSQAADDKVHLHNYFATSPASLNTTQRPD